MPGSLFGGCHTKIIIKVWLRLFGPCFLENSSAVSSVFAFSDRKSVKHFFCRSDFEFFKPASRKRTFSVEMSYFITKMSDFCFSFDFGLPGGFEPVQTYFQGGVRMSTAPGGPKLYSPARNRSYFKQKVSYFIQNWRIWTLEGPQRLPSVAFAIAAPNFNSIPHEWRSDIIFSVIF